MDGIVDYGASLTMRWVDVLEPQEEIEEDDRSCEEIVHGIWDRMRTRNDSI